MKKLVYTIAQNGYERAFGACIRSQKAYAQRIGAEFVCVVKPSYVPLPALSAWLKVPVMVSALRAGYDFVAYIDADCEVRPDAPDFSELLTDGDASVHMALGRSGRFNSGVMFAKADSASRGFYDEVMTSMTQSIPAEDRANLKYENGNIIFVANKVGGVAVLPKVWNNTEDVALRDHVRHYSGPMQAHYRRSLIDAAHYWFIKRTISRRPPQPEQRGRDFEESLEALVAAVVEEYPSLERAAA